MLTSCTSSSSCDGIGEKVSGPIWSICCLSDRQSSCCLMTHCLSWLFHHCSSLPHLPCLHHQVDWCLPQQRIQLGPDQHLIEVGSHLPKYDGGDEMWQKCYLKILSLSWKYKCSMFIVYYFTHSLANYAWSHLSYGEFTRNNSESYNNLSLCSGQSMGWSWPLMNVCSDACTPCYATDIFLTVPISAMLT